jgi:hypothetical protein
MTKRKVWLKPPMTFPIPNRRGASVTVIGAISNQVGLIHYKVLKGSNNTSTFLEFVKELMSCVPLMPNPFLVTIS